MVGFPFRLIHGNLSNYMSKIPKMYYSRALHFPVNWSIFLDASNTTLTKRLSKYDMWTHFYIFQATSISCQKNLTLLWLTIHLLRRTCPNPIKTQLPPNRELQNLDNHITKNPKHKCVCNNPNHIEPVDLSVFITHALSSSSSVPIRIYGAVSPRQKVRGLSQELQA